MNSVTLKDIAKIAKVSISTASKALNNSTEISQPTIDRIKQVAEQYNYSPNYIALSLKSKSTKTIGVVIPDILNYFFVEALYGIEEEARKNGFKVITCVSNNSYQSEVKNINILTNGSVDGIILSLSKGSQVKNKFAHINSLINKNIPIVLFDRVTDNLQCDKIISDNYKGALQATNQLIKSGCKKIGLITKFNDLSVVKDRARGFMDAMKLSNIFDDKIIININNLEDADRLIENLIKKNKLDAILSTNEILAIRSIKVANKLGLKVPDKLKVVGFSNGILSKEFHPSLSVVDLQPKKIGIESVKSLIKKIKNKSEMTNTTKVVKSRFISRESSLNL